MFLFNTHYPCPLSKVAFASLIEILNSELQPSLHYHNRYVAFVDGDSIDVHNTIKQIYYLRKENKTVYVITLLSQDKECSAVIKHLSDFVVDKKIGFTDLKSLVKVMGVAEPKSLADNIFGDIFGEILKTSQKENRVLQLLIDGYSQSQIAKMMHLSIKTVSGYKVKAVKRHGARNFNELYMLKYGNRLSKM
ncbi:helix-turn-helix domain-containing protein [Serratia marcescens]|uniref:helix-turn-helix domain-containing protein n=1 Tax=Serratia marcescens TaxID=615 RepID=UPI003EDF61F5